MNRSSLFMRFSSASHSAVRQIEASYCLLRLGFPSGGHLLDMHGVKDHEEANIPIYQYIYISDAYVYIYQKK